MSDAYSAWINGYFWGLQDVVDKALANMARGMEPREALLRAQGASLGLIVNLSENWQGRERIVRLLRAAPLTNIVEVQQDEQHENRN